MAYRFTNTDKWSDGWFVDLKPTEKLLFLYLVDNCDIAGFFEVSLRKLSFELGINERGLQGALEGLTRGLIFSDDRSIIYLRTFLKNQKNLPLNPANKAHQGIIRRFDKYADRFNLELLSNVLKINLFQVLNIEKTEGQESPYKGATEGLLSPTGIGIGIDKGLARERVVRERDPKKSDPEEVEVVTVEDEFTEFQAWILKNAASCAKMQSPLTREEYYSLTDEYNLSDIEEILGAMHNYKPLLKKCVSTNLTARNWLRRDKMPKKHTEGQRTTTAKGKVGSIINNIEEALK